MKMKIHLKNNHLVVDSDSSFARLTSTTVFLSIMKFWKMLIHIIHKHPHLDTYMTYIIKKKEARIHLHLDFHNTKGHYRLRISIFILAHANDLSYMRFIRKIHFVTKKDGAKVGYLSLLKPDLKSKNNKIARLDCNIWQIFWINVF